MAAEALAWGLSPLPVLTDIAYGVVAEFYARLSSSEDTAAWLDRLRCEGGFGYPACSARP
jgi:hypothetical protein